MEVHALFASVFARSQRLRWLPLAAAAAAATCQPLESASCARPLRLCQASGGSSLLLALAANMLIEPAPLGRHRVGRQLPLRQQFSCQSRHTAAADLAIHPSIWPPANLFLPLSRNQELVFRRRRRRLYELGAVGVC